MKLGEKLQQLRKRSGLSQEQLASQLAVSRQAVSKWELDETMPDTENVIQLSRIFGVSCDYLLQDGVDEKGNPVKPPVTRLLEQAQGRRVKLTFYEGDGMPVVHEWCVIQDFDGAWANVEVVVNQKKPQKNEVRLIPLSAISTITFLKDGEAAKRSLLELN